MNSTVHEMIAQGKQYLEDRNYTQGSIEKFLCVWRRFERFLREANRAETERADGEAFLTSRGITTKVSLSSWQRHQRRAMNCLFDIWERREYPLGYHRAERYPLPECFRHVHGAYIMHIGTQGLAAQTVNNKSGLARRFLNYVESYGIYDITDICRETIYNYLLMPSSQRTKTHIKFFLREFLRFLVDGFGANSELASIFPVILENKKDTLPSVYSAEELSKVYGELDGNSQCAKRDRAIFLLALQLGMRAGDIRMLKYENVDWRLHRLSFTQQKTKREIVLPLPDECMFALLDYLKNERPKVDNPYIFLRRLAPHEPLSDKNTYYAVISGCYDRAGVDTSDKHCGLHSVRHSIAVNMLLSDTPYPVITGVLGHESSNTTKAYLRVDVERLRALCLEVPHVS